MIRNYYGYCENCKKEKNIKDFSLEAKKIISGVGRAKESLGISTLANMLMGKADTKMLNKGLDKISTFGIMREDKQEWIESFIKARQSLNQKVVFFGQQRDRKSVV